jgi:hypothetical protein
MLNSEYTFDDTQNLFYADSDRGHPATKPATELSQRRRLRGASRAASEFIFDLRFTTGAPSQPTPVQAHPAVATAGADHQLPACRVQQLPPVSRKQQ